MPISIKTLYQRALRLCARLDWIGPLVVRLIVGVAFFFDGRGKLGHLEKVIGYFTDLDGVSVSLFRGTPSETTACLTLRTDVFTAQPLPNNGSIALSVPGPVILHLYFNNSPSNNWNDSDTFSSGKEVARFNRSANLSVSDGSISSATFSLDLLFSQDFTIGQEVNFAKIAPHGVTNSNIGSTTPVTGSGNFTLALPFVAAGIAIGNNDAHGQWESADEN